ncbi:MAG: hypothetical protein IH914_04075 [candidate division Zixibacteria bacterium]|nr:hypothetical protein [candidate division Zixibacteria bacterium]
MIKYVGLHSPRLIFLALGILLITGAFYSCEEEVGDAELSQRTLDAYWDNMVLDTFPINTIERNRTLGIGSYRRLEDDTLGKFDQRGIQVFYYRGKGPYYHPVSMLNRLNRLLQGYVITSNPNFLAVAVATYDKLMDEAIYTDLQIWLPYRFDFYITNEDTVFAPFYSGMSQGLALSVTCYLFEITGDSSYLPIAEKLFRTLLLPKDKSMPWVVRLDTAGYYWIEEYPLPIHDRTLNGSIIGTFGLYDYWKLTGSDAALKMLRGAVATYAEYGRLYRRPGETSYYSLGYKKIANMAYHHLHISLFDYLSRISENPYFGAFADTLKMDVGNGS